MGLTKAEMYISIIGLILIVAFSINLIGGDLVNNGIDLDDRSVDYISEFSTNVNQQNFSDFSDNSTLQAKETNPIVDGIQNLPVISDFLGAVKFFSDKISGLLSVLAFIYNIPSFFIWGFALPSGAFTHVINIISYLLFLAVSIIALRLVK